MTTNSMFRDLDEATEYLKRNIEEKRLTGE